MAAPDPMIWPASAWADRFRALLAGAGLSAGDVLDDALAETPPWAGADDNAPRGLALASILAQPARLADHARRYPDPLPPEDTQALRARLSVLHQGLCLQVLAPLVLRLFRDGHAPQPDPARIRLVPSAGGEPDWRFHPGAEQLDETTFVHALAGATRAWYPVFRRALGVSPGAYWSSVGLALGAPFSTVWNRLDPQALCPLAQQWLAAFPTDAHRFIDWIPATFSGRTCGIPQRRGCCLKFRLPNGGYCGTCGIYRRERLAAIPPPRR
ncbi:(2Fe-2S)-binding protein [Marinobacter sp. C2H3]|uniref:(2Fe-2S)-binding protein n=1 Tax=Marinobacter sp. C2H3 TaxID=3119003 RepID=UPI00300F339C